MSNKLGKKERVPLLQKNQVDATQTSEIDFDGILSACSDASQLYGQDYNENGTAVSIIQFK